MAKAFFIAALLVAASLGCDSDEPPEVPSLDERAGEAAIPDARGADEPRPAAPVPAAWLDGEPIPRALVDEEFERIRLHFEKRRLPLDGSVAQVRHHQALQSVIDRILLQKRIAKAGIEISDAAVDDEIASRESRIFGSTGAMERHLAERGWSMPRYRDEVRLELAIIELFTGRSDPSEESVHALYRAVSDRPATVDRVRARSIIFPPDTPAAAIGAKLVSVQSEADFETLSARGARKLPIVEMAGHEAADYRIVDALFSVVPPGVSRPVATPSGVLVFWVLERFVEPTPHFRELEPMLHQHAAAIELASRRAELVTQLRRHADIRLPVLSAETDQSGRMP